MKIKSLLTLVLTFVITCVYCQVDLSPIKNFRYSPIYSIKVNGVTKLVYESSASLQTRPGGVIEQSSGIKKMSFVNFDMPQTGSATVEITLAQPFASYDFRPFKTDSALNVTQSGNTITFTIDQPMKTVLRINGSWDNVLVIFANPFHVKPNRSSVTYYFDNTKLYDTFNASKYPDLDPSNPNKDINDPLDIPQILLNEGESVYIEEGAVVRARFALNGNVNAKIFGRGVIVHGVGHNENDSWVIRANGPKSIELEGITVCDPMGWVVSIFGGNNNKIDNFKTVGMWHFNNDGIQIGANSSYIRNCFLECNDDNISLSGGGKDMDIYNNIFWNIFNGGDVNFGWGYPNYSNINIYNNYFIRHGDCCGPEFAGQNEVYRRKAPFSAISWGEGTLSNINFKNNIFEEVILESEWIHFRTIENKANPFTVNGLTIENLDIVTANKTWGLLQSYGTDKIQNVTFKNVRINGRLINSKEAGNLTFESVKESSVSFQNLTVPPTNPPTAPDGVTPCSISASEVLVKWKDKSNNETGFIVQRSLNETDWATIDTTGAHATNTKDGGLQAGTKYYYRVIAFNDAGNSLPSTNGSVVTTAQIPEAPSNLKATVVSSHIINLNWTDNSTVESYFKIDTSANGTQWKNIATVNSNTTSYTHVNLSPSTLCYYRVLAGNNSGESAYATTVNATTSNGSTDMPLPWLNQDIGAPSLSGQAAYANNIFTLKAAGWDIWDQKDEFHYVYQPLNGNGFISAKIVSQTNSNAWAKAGVMIRETLTGNSKHVFALLSYSNGGSMQWRATAGGMSNQTLINDKTSKPPYWVKLTRTGNKFIGFRSMNGTDWNAIDSITLPMNQNVYIGLAETGHNSSTICTTEYSDVLVNSLPTSVPENNLLELNVFPNPFKHKFYIHYSLKEKAQVCIELYSSVGSKISTIINTEKQAGTYTELYEGSLNTKGDEQFYLIKLTARTKNGLAIKTFKALSLN